MKKLVVILLAVAFAQAVAREAAADPDSRTPPNPAKKLQKSYVWYDGDRPRRIWINPGVIAEFDPEDRESLPGGGTVRKNYPKAREIEGRHKGAKLWQLEPGASSEAAAKHLNTKKPRNKYSPVFHDKGTSSARKRALPGNVIVTLDPGWDDSDVERWADSKRLEIVRKLEIGKNIVVVRTSPGLEALDTANALRGTEGVVETTPDWWEEVGLR